MKKFLALIMALMMLLSLAACVTFKNGKAKDDDKSVSEDKVDNETSDKKGSSDEDEDEKTTSKKDEELELEEVIVGTWVTEIVETEYSDMGDEMEGGLDSDYFDDLEEDFAYEFRDAFELEEITVINTFDFDKKGEVTISYEVDGDAIKDECLKNAEKYNEDMGFDEDDKHYISEDYVEEIVDAFVESHEGSDSGGYELDGNCIVFGDDLVDGDALVDVVIKSKDKIMMTNGNESYTFERK